MLLDFYTGLHYSPPSPKPLKDQNVRLSSIVNTGSQDMYLHIFDMSVIYVQT